MSIVEYDWILITFTHSLAVVAEPLAALQVVCEWRALESMSMNERVRLATLAKQEG